MFTYKSRTFFLLMWLNMIQLISNEKYVVLEEQRAVLAFLNCVANRHSSAGGKNNRPCTSFGRG